MSAVAAAATSRPRPGRLVRSLSDERLVARIRAGDQAAFEAIYDRHHRGLLSFCRHMLGDPDEAQDALQQVCVSAYNGIRADDRPIQLKAWLYAIARNRCLTILRARREHADVDDVQPAVEGLAAAVERREDLRELLGDLRRLPDDQRAALVLSELGAHTHEEVGVILEVPTAKVRALVFQAREHLQGARQARETDCSEIREQLSTLRGGALRRTQLRRHLDGCAGCTAFRHEVQRQRAAFGVLLPVVPGAALKGTVLAGVFGSGGAGGAAAVGSGSAVATGFGATGAAAAGAGAVVGGGGMFATIGAQGAAVKALAALAVAGGAGGSGYVAVNELRSTPAERPAAAVESTQRPASADGDTPAAGAVGAPGPSSAGPVVAAKAAPVSRGAGTTSETDRDRSTARKPDAGGTRRSGRPPTSSPGPQNAAGDASGGLPAGRPASGPPNAASPKANGKSRGAGNGRPATKTQRTPKAPTRRAAKTPKRSAAPGPTSKGRPNGSRGAGRKPAKGGGKKPVKGGGGKAAAPAAAAPTPSGDGSGGGDSGKQKANGRDRDDG